MRVLPTSFVATLLVCAASAPLAAPGAQEPVRSVASDPTSLDERLREALGRDGATPITDPAARVVLPELALRGLVIASGKPGTALVAVGDRLVRVAAGSSIVLDAASSTQARVVDVARGEVVLEIGASGERRVLR